MGRIRAALASCAAATTSSDDLAETVGGEPVALVGASYGGLVCLDFAARTRSS